MMAMHARLQLSMDIALSLQEVIVLPPLPGLTV